MSKKRKLTPKQEKFCQLYVNGATKADAYRGAYSTKNQSNSTITNNAYMLSMRSDVLARIEQLRKELAEKNKYTLEKSVKKDLRLIEIYENALAILQDDNSTEKQLETASRTIRHIGATGYSSAQERLSKQHGFFAPEKRELDVTAKDFNLKDLFGFGE